MARGASGQHDRLTEAGAIRTFTDVVAGAAAERPELARLIDHARPGDFLCVTRLDRLGRSLRELLEIVEDLKARDIHLAPTLAGAAKACAIAAIIGAGAGTIAED